MKIIFGTFSLVVMLGAIVPETTSMKHTDLQPLLQKAVESYITFLKTKSGNAKQDVEDAIKEATKDGKTHVTIAIFKLKDFADGTPLEEILKPLYDYDTKNDFSFLNYATTTASSPSEYLDSIPALKESIKAYYSKNHNGIPTDEVALGAEWYIQVSKSNVVATFLVVGYGTGN